MAFDFSADHIAAQSGGYEPQRLNHFSVRISGVGSAGIVEKSLLSFQPPMREIEEVVIPYANETRKVAGKVNVTEASLTVVDYCDKDTWKDFHDWLELVHDVRSGALGLASSYKKEATINYWGPDGDKKRAWKAIGVWPKSVSPEQFTMDSGERNNLTVPMATDKVLPESAA